MNRSTAAGPGGGEQGVKSAPFADDLDLFPVAQEAIAVPRGDAADDAVVAKIGEFGPHSNARPDRGGTAMVDGDAGADSFLIGVEVIDEHLPGGQLHVVDHGPGGIDPMDHDAVERRAHILGDDDLHLAGDPRSERRLHG